MAEPVIIAVFTPWFVNSIQRHLHIGMSTHLSWKWSGFESLSVLFAVSHPISSRVSHVPVPTRHFQLPLPSLKDIIRQLSALDSFRPKVQIILSKIAITEEGRKITSSHIHGGRVCYRIHSISPSCFCMQESGGGPGEDKQGPTQCRMIYTVWIDEYFHLNAKY